MIIPLAIGDEFGVVCVCVWVCVCVEGLSGRHKLDRHITMQMGPFFCIQTVDVLIC